jgi:hypothetical protein
MVNYKCPRCGYETHIKTIYIRHLGRKYICETKISDNDLQNEYKKYNILSKIKNNNTKLKMKPNEAKMKHKEAKCKPNEANKSNNFKCEYCKKIYFHRQSLYKHLKKCEDKKKDEEDKLNLLNLVNLLNIQLEEQKQQLERRDKQIEEQNIQIKELIKKTGINIGTQNVQQNINILAYNNTDISHLTDKDYLKCLKHSNFCIPHLIEKIHFNPKKPENHNIYISNLKNNYVMIYNGNKWMINDRDESIQNLIDDKELIMEQKLEEWIENGNQYPDIMKKFNRYIEKKENDKVLNKVKAEIKLLLFNNRDIMTK